MKRYLIIWMVLMLTAFVPVDAQRNRGGRTTVTGTAVIYGSGRNTRTVTRTFTLTINGETTAADIQRDMGMLQERGQNGLLEAVRNRDLGQFALGGSVGVPVNGVIVDNYNGKRRIRAIMQRWIGFGEYWGGNRSVDYPFSYVEIQVDPRTGEGEGQFFPAAQIRFKNNTVTIEDFGTFPARLMGVRVRGALLS